MRSSPLAKRLERLHQLLADRARVGLTRKEERELVELLGILPELDAAEVERVANACSLSNLEIPISVEHTMVDAPPRTGTLIMAERPGRVGASPRARRTWPRGAAGWVAAGLCLVVAAGTWMTRPPRPASSPADGRTALLAKPGVLKADLTATAADLAGARASGDVVWCDAEQRGFVHIHGLPRNEPAIAQYQLWILDPARDAHPVAGGVFDVDGDDVVVPIHAALPVARPSLFAVTAEKPGGVVVSTRERVLVTAKPLLE